MRPKPTIARVGRMVLEGTLLQADPRQGLLEASREGRVVRFKWTAEGAEDAELDAKAAADDVEIQMIPRPSARVFLIKYPKDRSKDLFFWSCSGSADEAEAVMDSLRDLLSPSAEEAAESGARQAAGAGAASRLGGRGRSQAAAVRAMLAETAAVAAGWAGRPDEPAQEPAGDERDRATLARTMSIGLSLAFFRALMPGEFEGESSDEGGKAALPEEIRQLVRGHPSGPPDALRAEILAELGIRRAAAPRRPISLRSLLEPGAVRALLERHPGLAGAVAEHLPPSQRSRDSVLRLIGTPQWGAQLSLISQALNTGSLHPQAFGVQVDEPGVQGLVAGLLRGAAAKRPRDEAVDEGGSPRGDGDRAAPGGAPGAAPDAMEEDR